MLSAGFLAPAESQPLQAAPERRLRERRQSVTPTTMATNASARSSCIPDDM